MKKLIIVCEEKYRVYGDYLAQLISLEDDTEDSTVGVKDGEVAAQVWLEKDYKANSAQLSSNQYILFIGHNKLIKEKSSHMKVAFSQYGMAYGWLGKQAVLCVNKVVSAKEYNDFITFREASFYTGISEKKLIEITNLYACPFVLWMGNRRFIKRKTFDKFIQASEFKGGADDEQIE